MLPYIVFIILLLICYYKRWPMGMIGIVILFAALRYDVGWDYNMYCHIVRSPIEWNNEDTSRFSFPWRELFRFAHEYNTPHFAIILPNIITYIILYCGLSLLKMKKRQKVDAIFVYVMWYELYLGSFSIIRQEISMSLGFLLFALLQRKKFLVSIIVLLLASWLHSSASVLIILYPVYLLRNKLNVKWVCISTVVIFFAVTYASYLLTNLSFIDMSKYEDYLKPSDNTGGKIIYVNILLSAYLILVFYRSKRLSAVDKQCYFLTITSLIGNVAIYFLGLSTVLGRIFSYFVIFLIPILLSSLHIFKGAPKIKPVAISALVTFFFAYLYITQGGEKLASSGYLPYKFILENL